MGIETEFGVTCTFHGHRRLSPDEVARQLALMVQRDGFVSAYDDGEVHVLKRLGAPDIDLETAP